MFQELGMFSDSIGMFSSDINQLPAPGLNLDFASGTLDPRVTFTRTQSTYGNVTYTGSNRLIQYAGVNLLTYSQAFTNAAWSTARGTVTSSAAIAPDGTNTATVFVEDNTTNTRSTSQSPITVTSGATYTYSCYLKNVSRQYVSLIIADTATGLNAFICTYDLINGVVTQTAIRGSGVYSTSSIVSVGNGWYRCVVTGNVPTTSAIAIVSPCNTGTPTIGTYGRESYTGDGTSSFYFWGAQLEPTSSATTYIPTTSAASGAARFDYNSVTLAANGLLIEESRANLLTYSRDLTNVSWVKVNVTAALNQIGADGVVNSASSITATAGNATVLQALTSVSAARASSCYIKRLTGTGVINMTQDAGVTWTPVTVTSSWTRVSIPSATIVNPSFGLQIVTNGDSIAVDFCQLENGAFSTSAIVTTTTSITRNADNASMTGANFSSWYNATQGTLVSIAIPYNVSAIRGGFVASDGTANNTIETAHGSTPRAFINTGGVTQLSQASGSVAANSIVKSAISYQANNANGACNGVAGTAVLSCSIPTVNKAIIGNVYDGSNALNGTISKIIAYTVRLPDNTLKGLTS